MNYLIFSSIADFSAVNDIFNAQFGYPSANTSTYAVPISHPVNGQVAMVIEDRCLLTADQTAELKDESYMFENGWFRRIV